MSMRVFVFADTFFFQMSIKLLSRRQFCFLKFVSTVHIFVAVSALLEDKITVWEMALCMLKFIHFIFNQTLTQRVKWCVQEL